MAYSQAAALDALGDPTRRSIFERLREGPRPVVEIARGMPVSRPAVSQHLRVLKEAGLVHDRQEGNRRLYAVNPKGLEGLRRYLDGFWGDVLDAFKETAEQDKGRGANPWSRPRRKSRRSTDR
jgi:DNA-binding transcriptional ArsR family regulator